MESACFEDFSPAFVILTHYGPVLFCCILNKKGIVLLGESFFAAVSTVQQGAPLLSSSQCATICANQGAPGASCPQGCN